MNQITIIGNIGQQPELRVSPSGVAVIDFSVGVTRKVKDVKETEWFDVVAFTDLADHFAHSFGKGNRVIITGRMQRKEWEGKDGKKGYKMQIIADDGGLSCRWNNTMVENFTAVKEVLASAFQGSTVSIPDLDEPF